MLNFNKSANFLRENVDYINDSLLDINIDSTNDLSALEGAKHVNMADANLALLPDGLSDEGACMLVDMWSTGMVGSENANIPLGGSVLVIGIGAVGLSAIAGAK